MDPGRKNTNNAVVGSGGVWSQAVGFVLLRLAEILSSVAVNISSHVGWIAV
jgi:hypothetical protein